MLEPNGLSRFRGFSFLDNNIFQCFKPAFSFKNLTPRNFNTKLPLAFPDQWGGVGVDPLLQIKGNSSVPELSAFAAHSSTIGFPDTLALT
eukprot:1403261-Amphidinium_carterae.1